jgi:hypothetical protein
MRISKSLKELKKRRKIIKTFLIAILLPLCITSCYTYKWTNTKTLTTSAPEEIKQLFNKDSKLTTTGISPNSNYKYDAWEKDVAFNDNSALNFNKITLSLNDAMPEGQILVDMVFEDGIGNKIKFNAFDLMRIVPTLNSSGEHLYPELLLEEFNRFGVGFRKEFNEFEIERSEQNTAEINKALDRVYRASITNGCLDPGKWEIVLTSEDYSDFNSRIKNPVNYNQNKILAHSWFLIPKKAYKALVELKNPNVKLEGFDFGDFDYKTLSNFSKGIEIDFEKLRKPIKKTWDVEMVEVGHESNRPIELLDMEEHYKVDYGLFVGYNKNSLDNETYKSILNPEKQPLKFAQFRDEGFYSPETALTFDMNWLSHLNEITIKSVDLQETECVVEIQVKGKWSPYTLTIGNLDLSTLQEQKLYGLHFGFNTYPKGRRYNPAQATTTFDEDLMPKDYERYVLLTDSKTGHWVDNFHKGLGKVYLSFDSLEKDVLNIHLISYERIAPLWIGRVKLPNELRERARIRKQLYNY